MFRLPKSRQVKAELDNRDYGRRVALILKQSVFKIQVQYSSP